MAKKSNKTEHVLKLITKAEEADRDDVLFAIEDITEKGASSVKNIIQAEPEDFQDEIERGLDQLMGKEPPDEEEPQKIEPQLELPVRHEPPTEKEPEHEMPTAQEPLPNTPAEKEPPTIRAFREQEGAGNVVLEPSEELVNIAEVLAREKLSLVMDRMNVCMCKTCVNDVLALTLNSLPTKYVTTDAGKQYFQRDEYKKEYETEILAALTKACVRVKASPRH